MIKQEKPRVASRTAQNVSSTLLPAAPHARLPTRQPRPKPWPDESGSPAARAHVAHDSRNRPPTKRKCRNCTIAALPDCKHCICPGCNWCLFRQEAGRQRDPARDAPALATLALLAQNGKGTDSGIEPATCGAMRESGGSVRCRSCRRHNVERGVKSNVGRLLGGVDWSRFHAGEEAQGRRGHRRAAARGARRAREPVADGAPHPGRLAAGGLFPTGLEEQPLVGPPPTRIIGASEWPAAAVLSRFAAAAGAPAGACQAWPPPGPTERAADEPMGD